APLPPSSATLGLPPFSGAVPPLGPPVAWRSENPMNRITALVVAGLILMVGVTPSWGGPPNPTASDAADNTAGGTNALRDVTGGFSNTAFGFAALLLNTTGSQNIATGSHALLGNTTGVHNTATGNAALYANNGS